MKGTTIKRDDCQRIVLDTYLVQYISLIGFLLNNVELNSLDKY